MNSTISTFKANREAAHYPPADFGRLAHIYRWAEWLTFGPFLSKCRSTFLSRMNSRRSALVIGDGDGRFTARLLQQNSHIVVEALDGSAPMLQELVRRSEPHANRVTTLHLDACAFIPERRSYDLVVTHFFLDCLTTDEVARLASRLCVNMTEDAFWVVSEFAVPRSPFMRIVAKFLISALYSAFGILTGLRIRELPDHTTALADSGFRLIERRERLLGLLVSELWQADGGHLGLSSNLNLLLATPVEN